jgi:hypothetical protein
MPYYLVQRFGPKDKPQFRKEEFSTEPEAVIKACALLAADGTQSFVVEDDAGNIVTNDREIRSRCKGTRTA